MRLVGILVAVVSLMACAGDDDIGPRFSCEEPLGSALRLVPERPLAIYSPDACVPGFSALLVNESDRTVRVERLQSGSFVPEPQSRQRGDGRLIATAALPQELAPLGSLAVELRFFSEATEIVGVAELEVLTSDGCERFDVLSSRSGESSIGHPLAVDLGVVGPGERSELVDIVFTSFGPPNTTLIVGEGLFGDFFEVVEPLAPTLLRSCEPLRASVRFNAPLEPGVYETRLLYEVVSDTEIGTLSGIGIIEARARVE